MAFFLDNLSFSTWNLALYISIAFLAISIVVYYATFYLKRKRFDKQKEEEDVEKWDEDSFLASIRSTKSSKSLKTAKSEMATTQRDEEKSSRDNNNNKSVGGLLQVKDTHINARLSDGKSPILPDNVLPKVKIPKSRYFDENVDDITQELTKSIREQEPSPPIETAHGPSSKSKSSAKDDSESTHTQTFSERSNSEGSSVGESTGAAPSEVPSEGEEDEEMRTMKDEGSEKEEEKGKEEDEDEKEKEETKEEWTSTEGTTTTPEEESESSSIGKN